jgi:thioester reductase-like protein
MTPVDFVSDGILKLSQQLRYASPSSSPCTVFHLCNSAPIHWSHFVSWMAKFGYALHLLPYTEWRQRLIEVARLAEKQQASGKKDGGNGQGPSSPASNRKQSQASAAADNALLPLLPIFSEKEVDMGTSETMPKFNASWTLNQCSALGVPCPSIDDNLLTVYFEFYISSGFLAPPQRENDQFSLDDDEKGGSAGH